MSRRSPADLIHDAARVGKEWLTLQAQACRAVKLVLSRLKREHGMTGRAVARAIGVHEIWLTYVKNGHKPAGLVLLTALSRLLRRLDRKP